LKSDIETGRRGDAGESWFIDVILIQNHPCDMEAFKYDDQVINFTGNFTKCSMTTAAGTTVGCSRAEADEDEQKGNERWTRAVPAVNTKATPAPTHTDPHRSAAMGVGGSSGDTPRSCTIDTEAAEDEARYRHEKREFYHREGMMKKNRQSEVDAQEHREMMNLRWGGTSHSRLALDQLLARIYDQRFKNAAEEEAVAIRLAKKAKNEKKKTKKKKKEKKKKETKEKKEKKEKEAKKAEAADTEAAEAVEAMETKEDAVGLTDDSSMSFAEKMELQNIAKKRMAEGNSGAGRKRARTGWFW
jgi:hypothetical protein